MSPLNDVPSDEEEVLNNIDENTSLRNENLKKVKKSNWQTLCCKSFIILVAVIVFLAILVRSWTDYGSYIKQHVFPPSVYSLSVQCQNQSNTMNLFNAPECRWNTTTTYDLSCTLEKPTNYFVDITSRDNAEITWTENLVIRYNQNISCTNVMIWSI